MTDDYDEIAASWEDDDEVREVCFWCAKPKDGMPDDDTTEVLDVQPCNECREKWDQYKDNGNILLFEYTQKHRETLCKRGYNEGQADRIRQLCIESGLKDYILTGSWIALPKEQFDILIASSLDSETLTKIYATKMMFVEDDVFTNLFRQKKEEETNEDT